MSQAIKYTRTVLRYMVTAVGPVRNLQCNYDTLRAKTLSCVWQAPKQAHAPSQAYAVNVTHDGNVIWNVSTPTLKLDANVNLKQGNIYIVSVRTITGAIAKTRIFFSNSGVLLLYLLHFNPSHFIISLKPNCTQLPTIFVLFLIFSDFIRIHWQCCT